MKVSADDVSTEALGAADTQGADALARLAAPTPRRAGTQRLLSGPVLGTLIRLAAPNVVVVLVQAASSTVDAFFVARLGTDVLAGVALVFPAWMLMVTMSAGGIGGGISSAIARALGGGRRRDADALAFHGVLIGVVLAAIFTVGMLMFGEPTYRALGGSGAALDAAMTYSTFIFSGALAVWLVNSFGSVLRGSGQMMVPALVIVAGEVIHLILAPTLIFGFQLGIAGAGLSLVISYVLRATALAAFAFSKRSTVRPTVVPISTHQTWDILKVGLPGAINTILTNVNVAAITGIVGTFGTAALAGYGLGARLEYLQIPLVFGFGTALVTLVGTNVGAGQIDRARRIAWLGAGLAAALTGSIGLLAAIWPNVWLGAFTDVPQVREIGEMYLRIVGPTYGFFGLGLALYFAAQGTGQLLWSVLAGVLRLVIALAAGWFAINVLNGGLPAVFAGIATSFVVFGAAQSVAITRALRQSQLRFKLQ